MNYGTRYFVLLEGKIQPFGIERFSQLYHGVVPEYAGQKIPYALLLFERQKGKPRDQRYWRGSYLVFNKEGKVDQESGWNHIELTLTEQKDSRSFAARRAE
jgi:hypothetical protein